MTEGDASAVLRFDNSIFGRGHLYDLLVLTGPDRLLAPLSPGQRGLVDVVFKSRRTNSRWPNYRFVERAIRTSALPLLHSFPSLGTVGYSAVWVTSRGGMHHDDDRVGLTVAGLAHVDGGDRFYRPFFRFLDFVAGELDALPNDPENVPSLSLRFGDIARGVRESGANASLLHVDAVLGLLEHEPITWTARGTDRREDWTWPDVGWHLSRFAGISDVADYLDRLWSWTQPSWAAPPNADVVAPPADSTPTAAASVQWIEAQHVGLRVHIEQDIASDRWIAAVREACVYLEDELRSRGRLASHLVGVELAQAAFGTGGALVMPVDGSKSEQEGWHLLCRGFTQAVRNPFAHRRRETSEVTASSAIGVVSLILTALDEHHPRPD